MAPGGGLTPGPKAKARAAPSGSGTLPSPAPDLILRSGEIHAMDARGAGAEALAATAGRIVAMGSDREVWRLRGARTLAVDLKGRFALPGFIDCHTHFTKRPPPPAPPALPAAPPGEGGRPPAAQARGEDALGRVGSRARVGRLPVGRPRLPGPAGPRPRDGAAPGEGLARRRPLPRGQYAPGGG